MSVIKSFKRSRTARPESWCPTSFRILKQVAAWLGHADAAFTLRMYVSLMDEGVGNADFLDEAVRVGKGWATDQPEPAATDEVEEALG